MTFRNSVSNETISVSFNADKDFFICHECETKNGLRIDSPWYGWTQFRGTETNGDCIQCNNETNVKWHKVI